MTEPELVRSGSITVEPDDWGRAWIRHHRAIVIRSRPWWIPDVIWTRLINTVVNEKAWTERGVKEAPKEITTNVPWSYNAHDVHMLNAQFQQMQQMSEIQQMQQLHASALRQYWDEHAGLTFP